MHADVTARCVARPRPRAASSATMTRRRSRLGAGLALALVALLQGCAPAASPLKDGARIDIDGITYSAHNGSRPWSLTREDDVLRFEVRSGDRWRNDPETRERSEIKGPVYPEGVALVVEYEFMIEPGPRNTARDMILGQFHADDLWTSPPFAVRLRDERLRVNVAWGEPDSTTTKVLFRDSQDVERGHYYQMRIEVRFAHDRTGFARVWRDGKQIANYRGPVGYGYGNYWKQGIYRPAAKETMAISYRNLTVTVDNGV